MRKTFLTLTDSIDVRTAVYLGSSLNNNATSVIHQTVQRPSIYITSCVLSTCMNVGGSLITDSARQISSQISPMLLVARPFSGASSLSYEGLKLTTNLVCNQNKSSGGHPMYQEPIQPPLSSSSSSSSSIHSRANEESYLQQAPDSHPASYMATTIYQCVFTEGMD